MNYSLIYNLRKLIRLLLWFPVMIIAKVWPRDSKLIVFGAWAGELFIDNPKYFLLYVLQNSKFNCIWIGNDCIRDKIPIHSRLHFVKKGSLGAIFALLRAKTWICCQGIEHDFSKLPLYGSALLINFWHGIPLKHIGILSPWNSKFAKEPFFSAFVKKVTCLSTCWLSSSSKKMGEEFPIDSPDLFHKDKILYYGTPRNDFLIHNTNNFLLQHKIKEKYSKLFNFSVEKKIVCYLPTWRRSGDYVKTFYGLSKEEQKKWKEMLESHNAVLIEKHHYRTYEDYPIEKPSACSITVEANKQGDVDVQELLLITDVLISDYSGAYIDFALLKRPCIHFAHDLENYKQNDSGLMYDYENVVAGPIVKSFEDLIKEVDVVLNKPCFSPASEFHTLVEFERGNANKQMLDFIVKNHNLL